MAKHRPEEIRRELLRTVFSNPHSPVTEVAKKFGVTRQAAQKHLASLVEQGFLKLRGRAPHRLYELAYPNQTSHRRPLKAGLDETSIWKQTTRPALGTLDREADDICHYGVTEMVNNVIDHSEGRSLRIVAGRGPVSARIDVMDDGVGLFEKIAAATGARTPADALLELSKGKFTTDPRRHTGEGLFFSSRVFDRFAIHSGPLLAVRTVSREDWELQQTRKQRGTSISMELLVPAQRTLESVFSRFSSGPDDYRFAKTHVPIKLARFGDETLMSRSSARRVLARIDRFDEAELDFRDVRTIGQGFADEMFRVFPMEHPQVKLTTINANDQVMRMIRRALAG